MGHTITFHLQRVMIRESAWVFNLLHLARVHYVIHRHNLTPLHSAPLHSTPLHLTSRDSTRLDSTQNWT